MTERQIAIVHCYDDLHAALRARAEHLRLTREAIDGEAADVAPSWNSGYASKLLAPLPVKALGRTSLGPMLHALGLVMILVEDEKALKRLGDLQSNDPRAGRCSKPLQAGTGNLPEIRTLQRKALHQAMQKNGGNGGRKSGEARRQRKARIPRWKRRAIARKAARARWRRSRATSHRQPSAAAGS